ncbi:hypothetical protein AAMO2058_000365300 [Amorphochlora amoebiformis]
MYPKRRSRPDAPPAGDVCDFQAIDAIFRRGARLKDSKTLETAAAALQRIMVPGSSEMPPHRPTKKSKTESGRECIRSTWESTPAIYLSRVYTALATLGLIDKTSQAPHSSSSSHISPPLFLNLTRRELLEKAKCVWQMQSEAPLHLARMNIAQGNDKEAEAELRISIKRANEALNLLNSLQKDEEGERGILGEMVDAGALGEHELALVLLRNDKSDRADKILKSMGFSHRLNAQVFRPFSPPNPNLKPENSPPLPWPASLVRAWDDALPREVFLRLKEAFKPERAYWGEHRYWEPDTSYFSYWHGLTPSDPKPETLVELAIRNYIWPRAKDLIPAAARAVGAEWWVHAREPLSGHQMHFDTDEAKITEGTEVRHPIASCVLYLDIGATKNPTFITTQTFAGGPGEEGFLVNPKPNRLTVFDGSLLHGVVPSAPREVSASKFRVTFMVGFWTYDACQHSSRSPGPISPPPYLLQPLLPPGGRPTWPSDVALRPGDSELGDSLEIGEETVGLVKVGRVWEEVGKEGKEEKGLLKESQVQLIGGFFVKDVSSADIHIVTTMLQRGSSTAGEEALHLAHTIKSTEGNQLLQALEELEPLLSSPAPRMLLYSETLQGSQHGNERFLPSLLRLLNHAAKQGVGKKPPLSDNKTSIESEISALRAVMLGADILSALAIDQVFRLKLGDFGVGHILRDTMLWCVGETEKEKKRNNDGLPSSAAKEALTSVLQALCIVTSSNQALCRQFTGNSTQVKQKSNAMKHIIKLTESEVSALREASAGVLWNMATMGLAGQLEEAGGVQYLTRLADSNDTCEAAMATGALTALKLSTKDGKCCWWKDLMRTDGFEAYFQDTHSMLFDEDATQDFREARERIKVLRTLTEADRERATLAVREESPLLWPYVSDLIHTAATEAITGPGPPKPTSRTILPSTKEHKHKTESKQQTAMDTNCPRTRRMPSILNEDTTGSKRRRKLKIVD